jgi:hypothetical protein
MLFTSIINRIIPAFLNPGRPRKEIAAMIDNRKTATVRVVVSVVGFGHSVEIINRPYEVPEEYLDPETFISSCPEEYIAHRGRSYKYLDCLTERFMENGALATVYHIRYVLDVEKENFKSFLRTARPAHCRVARPA